MSIDNIQRIQEQKSKCGHQIGFNKCMCSKELKPVNRQAKLGRGCGVAKKWRGSRAKKSQGDTEGDSSAIERWQICSLRFLNQGPLHLHPSLFIKRLNQVDFFSQVKIPFQQSTSTLFSHLCFSADLSVSSLILQILDFPHLAHCLLFPNSSPSHSRVHT